MRLARSALYFRLIVDPHIHINGISSQTYISLFLLVSAFITPDKSFLIALHTLQLRREDVSLRWLFTSETYRAGNISIASAWVTFKTNPLYSLQRNKNGIQRQSIYRFLLIAIMVTMGMAGCLSGRVLGSLGSNPYHGRFLLWVSAPHINSSCNRNTPHYKGEDLY